MHIVIAHNAVSETDAPDEADVLIQVGAVFEALEDVGHSVEPVSVDLNLEKTQHHLEVHRPDLVFNLVESLSGSGRMIHFFPGLLDALAIPYTGASSEALYQTSNKLLAKVCLKTAGLPTPVWLWMGNDRLCSSDDVVSSNKEWDNHSDGGHWIIKSVWEHASLGLDDTAVVNWQGTGMMERVLKERAPCLGGMGFAEAYVEGREFNLSVLDCGSGPQVLPPAEIRFDAFDAGKHRIVDYRAKWNDASFEYHHTPRRFDHPPADSPLLEQLIQLSLECWRVFDLKGYARVDFRVDSIGNPWILEVNANPCLSPDAGFAAAALQSGLTYEAMIQRIISASPGLLAGQKPS